MVYGIRVKPFYFTILFYSQAFAESIVTKLFCSALKRLQYPTFSSLPRV